MKILLIGLLITSNIFAADVDMKKSVFQWTATKVTGEHTGKIFLKSSKIVEKKGNLVGGEFIANMDSITVEDLSGKWAKKFLKHMKSDDFFTVSKYPEAKLIISKLKDGKLMGKLSIKDKTNEISFPFVKKGQTYSGTMEFDRTKFAMVYGSGNFFKDLGDKMIHDKVKIKFTLVLK
ncbi:YceI family protein [Bacteriovoracaceae bacterium]|nr:YceI family protein [Bacteriovoracaceae bacterium]